MDGLVCGVAKISAQKIIGKEKKKNTVDIVGLGPAWSGRIAHLYPPPPHHPTPIVRGIGNSGGFQHLAGALSGWDGTLYRPWKRYSTPDPDECCCNSFTNEMGIHCVLFLCLLSSIDWHEIKAGGGGVCLWYIYWWWTWDTFSGDIRAVKTSYFSKVFRYFFSQILYTYPYALFQDKNFSSPYL